ncbi:DsbE family thiol:disulfide interchange protein [Alcanivorax quisquiliarum]|uniref:DsbE family thiol:disulfide interchange protein n=1 Tax=Alcanivorax quisquiliarum TaxID=2933565 RepID=A0ABT0E782_9GAMM|nr:DsbE family thiol:disulfide interchange protein [Alcanivorax quisquiliarum]MCK0537684.1 DsbE family thiol:disulfide interchange protein [Alcanivorax quisquiliarum]
MKRPIWALVPLLLLLGLVVMLYNGLGRDTETLPSQLVGQPMPPFQLPSLLGADSELDESLFRGRWMLLNVWATWCPTCYVEHPYFMQLAREGVAIVGLNYKDQDDKARQYLAELGNPYTHVVVDKRGTLAMDLGVYGAPETYLVNPEGKIMLRHAGEVNARVWAQKFAPLWPGREALEQDAGRDAHGGKAP